MVGFLDKYKQQFIEDVNHEINEYFEGLDVGRCFDLVEVEETRNADGSVTTRRLQSYPFGASRAALLRMRVLMQQREANQEHQPARLFLDSAHTAEVTKLVQRQFDELYGGKVTDVAVYFLDLELQLPSKQASLCSYVREQLRSAEIPLTPQQLADVSSLEDCEIVNDILQLVPESGKEEYRRATVVIEECLSRPLAESSTALFTLPLLPRSSVLRQASAGSRVTLENLVRTIIMKQLTLLLSDLFPGVTDPIRAPRLKDDSLLQVYHVLRSATISIMLRRSITVNLAIELDKSFKEWNATFLKNIVLRKGDGIMDLVVNKLLSSDAKAKIVRRISGLSPRARKALARKPGLRSQGFTKEEFELISSEKYPWLQELRELKMSDEEVAEVLLHEHQAGPWMFFSEMDSEQVPPSRQPIPNHHVNSCAHLLLGAKNAPPLPRGSMSIIGSPASFEDVETLAKLHRLCGLAGIFPTWKEKEMCNKFVAFEGKEDAVAHISYRSLSYPSMTSQEDVLTRIVETLEGLCTALAEAQDLGLCCNSYTVLCIQPVDDRAYIEAFRIQIPVVWQLLEELRFVLMQPKDRTSRAFSMLVNEYGPLHTTLQPLLGSQLGRLRTSDDSDDSEDDAETIDAWLHYCSLAAQFLSMAFLSYTQAHKGELLPSFLANPLRQVTLRGARMLAGGAVSMAIRPLTCIGDMLGEPVICFHVLPCMGDFYRADLSKHHIYADMADIVDTWGPAELLCASSHKRPFAMRIGGGLLYAEATNAGRYHWSKTAGLVNVSRSAMSPARKVLIGAVRVNDDCQSNYEDLRGHASLQTLGTQGPSSYFGLDNVSFTIGGLFRVIAQASFKHNAGISHKEIEKDAAQNDVMSLVDYRSAVQVSYCTGICRRVRFRDMVADLLREFGPPSVQSADETSAWQRLLNSGVDSRLRGEGNVILEGQNLSLFKAQVREMYDTLFHSGMDRDRRLRVAWPSTGDRRAYSEILCTGTNAWAEVLSESTRMSTYAYIAPHCLQALGGNPAACQSGWVPASGLSRVRAFATKVQCVSPSMSASELAPGSLCFFQLLGKMVFMQVHRPAGEPIKLRVVLQTTPASALRSLIALRSQRRRAIPQLQEIRAGSAAWAEDVLIDCAD